MSGSDDFTIDVWKVETGQLIQSLREHTAWVRSVVFFPNGENLASGGYDNIVCVWSID